MWKIALGFLPHAGCVTGAQDDTSGNFMLPFCKDVKKGKDALACVLEPWTRWPTLQLHCRSHTGHENPLALGEFSSSQS
jgi:hypothetical protein